MRETVLPLCHEEVDLEKLKAAKAMELGSGRARILTQVGSTQSPFLPLDRQEVILVRPQLSLLWYQIILDFLFQVTSE